jgi:hypothetical protein
MQDGRSYIRPKLTSTCTYYDFQTYLFVNSFCMLEVRFKNGDENLILSHYAQMLRNPIKAFGNPASAKIGRLTAVYLVSNPVLQE